MEDTVECFSAIFSKDRGVKKVKSSNVLMCDLHFNSCPLAHNPELWNNLGLEVENSPHVDFLRYRVRHGKKKALQNLYDTRYCKMYQYWDKCKYGLGGRDKEYIMKKAISILKLFDSISKKGYDKNSRVQILKTPLWTSRGLVGGNSLKGPEIFHGHHRISCLFVLGKEKVNVDICKDTMPNSKVWGQKLHRMKGYKS